MKKKNAQTNIKWRVVVGKRKSLFFYLENMIMLCDDDDGKTLNISFVCWDVTNGGWSNFFVPFFTVFLLTTFVFAAPEALFLAVSILN